MPLHLTSPGYSLQLDCCYCCGGAGWWIVMGHHAAGDHDQIQTTGGGDGPWRGGHWGGCCCALGVAAPVVISTSVRVDTSVSLCEISMRMLLICVFGRLNASS